MIRIDSFDGFVKSPISALRCIFSHFPLAGIPKDLRAPRLSAGIFDLILALFAVPSK